MHRSRAGGKAARSGRGGPLEFPSLGRQSPGQVPIEPILLGSQRATAEAEKRPLGPRFDRRITSLLISQYNT